MTTVAVVAHEGKTLGEGLDELRRHLTVPEVSKLIWHQVPKSRKAPKKVRKALKEGVDLLVVWGGDGMVQRCVDASAGHDVPVAIVPAGTANLLASNLGLPTDVAGAVRVALHGRRRRIDLGEFNGEHFAVMAGAGFDGALIDEADGALKRRLGRLAYFRTALRHLNDTPVGTTVRVDDATWFDGEASCVLLGNVGTITGGIQAFDDALADDGWLEVGVSTARGPVQWARTLAQMATGRSDRSPFVRITRAKRVQVTLAEPLMYELDGGAREKVKSFEAQVVPSALTVCVP